MSETYSGQLRRVKLMTYDDDMGWDHSENDKAAITAVLASLATAEKEREEAKLALEEAQRDLAEMTRCCKENGDAWVAEKCESAVRKGQLLTEIGLTEQQRDAAIAQAAGLREALEKIDVNADYNPPRLDDASDGMAFGKWQQAEIARVALATPGPSLAEIKAGAKAEVWEYLADIHEHDGDEYGESCNSDECFLCDCLKRARELRPEAERLRGGGK